MKSKIATILFVVLAVINGYTTVNDEAEEMTASEMSWEDWFSGCPAAMTMLKEQGFVVTDETNDMMRFYVYTWPYITTDSLLYAYFVTLERSYRALEAEHSKELAAYIPFVRDSLKDFRYGKPKEELITEAKEYGTSLETYIANHFHLWISLEPMVKEGRLDADWITAAQAVDDYLAVAQALATGKTSATELKDAPPAVVAEIDLILKAEGTANSPLRGILLDYSRFRPYALYPPDHELGNWFRARTWLTEVPFRTSNEEEAKQAFLLSLATGRRMSEDPELRKFGVDGEEALRINSDYSVFFGPTDNAEIGPGWSGSGLDLSNIINNSLPRPSSTLEENRAQWSKGWEMMKRGGYFGLSTGNEARVSMLSREYRLLTRPQCYDDIILGPLRPAGLIRPPISGEELMAVLGSAEAENIVIAREGSVISGYKQMLAEAKETVKKTYDRFSNTIYGKIIAVYHTLLTPPVDKTLPKYYLNPAWRYKDLNACLGAWTHGRFIWDGYGLSWQGSFPGWEEMSTPELEPNMAFYEAMLRLTVSTEEYFVRRGVAPCFIGLASFLADVIPLLRKQLAREKLTSDEEMILQWYPGILRDAFAGETGGGTGGVALHPQENEDPVFASITLGVPIASSQDTDQERVAGLSQPRKICVLCSESPHGGFADGGVLSYRDYLGSAKGPDRMTLAAWRADNGWAKAAIPAWEKEFYRPYTQDEIFADLREGNIREQTFDFVEPALGEIIGTKLARREKFTSHLSHNSEQNPGDRLLALFKATAPRETFVATLFPILEQYFDTPDGPATLEELDYGYNISAICLVLEEVLSDEQVDTVMTWATRRQITEEDIENQYPKMLFHLIATSSGPHPEELLLKFLDENANTLTRSYNYHTDPWRIYHSGYLPESTQDYPYEATWQAALDELTDRPGLGPEWALLERLDRYQGWALESLRIALVQKWSEMRYEPSYSNGSFEVSPTEGPKPRDISYSPEGSKFLSALKKKLGRKKYDEYVHYCTYLSGNGLD